MRIYRSICVFIDSNGSLCVLLGSYTFVCVLMNPCGSLLTDQWTSG